MPQVGLHCTSGNSQVCRLGPYSDGRDKVEPELTLNVPLTSACL
jgi:hypothetical protein